MSRETRVWLLHRLVLVRLCVLLNPAIASAHGSEIDLHTWSGRAAIGAILLGLFGVCWLALRPVLVAWWRATPRDHAVERSSELPHTTK